MLGSMLVGFIIGLIAAAITNRGERMGCIGKMILGLLGAWIGQSLFGTCSDFISNFLESRQLNFNSKIP